MEEHSVALCWPETALETLVATIESLLPALWQQLVGGATVRTVNRFWPYITNNQNNIFFLKMASARSCIAVTLCPLKYTARER